MRYIVDNDLHIHSVLSSCSNDPEQSKERILQYAIDNGLKTICITDHFWDDAIEGASKWYAPQNYEHILRSKPLPQTDDVRFLFGCETELDKFLTLGLSKEKFELFDFIVVPVTHFHMKGFTMSEEDSADAQSKAKAWVKRVDAVLNMDLPFKKIGLAHLTCVLISKSEEEYFDVLRLIPKDELIRIFTKAAALGVGIELNSTDAKYIERDEVLRIFTTAKKCGCKFYFGSDAHHPDGLDRAKAIFEKSVDVLGLTEEDKFII